MALIVPGTRAEGAGGVAGAVGRDLPALLVVVLGAIAYAGSLGVPLQFDDLPNIVDQPAVHAVDLSPAQLAPALSGFPLGRWLARASFAVNHALGGLRPAGYHLVNLAFHLATALLVLALARRILDALASEGSRSRWALRLAEESDRHRGAAFAALLFAVHPIQTQAVTYVVQRMTVMGAFFAVAALVLWLDARARTGRGFRARVAGAVACAWLAVSCKENFAVLPGIVLLLEAVLRPGLGARLRARWGVTLAAATGVAAAAAAMLAWYAPVIRTEHARLGIPLGARLLSQGRILVHYLSLLALPLPGRLHVDYAWRASTGLLDPPTTLPGLLAVVGLAALAVVSVRRAPLVALGAGWFLVALAIEQSVLPIDLVFEQRLYFAGIGLFVLAGAALAALTAMPPVVPGTATPTVVPGTATPTVPDSAASVPTSVPGPSLARLAVPGTQARLAVPGTQAGRVIRAWAMVAPLALLLAAGTWIRNEQWADPARLFADEAGAGPGAARGLLTVASALRMRGRLDDAERVLRRAIALAPDEPGGYVNLGNVELDRGHLAAAEAWYREAIARNRRMGDAWYDLGILLTRTGRGGEAMAAYREAIAADRTYTSARVNLALLQNGAGDLAGALSTLDEAIRVDPGSVSALSNRAVLRAGAGHRLEALEDARLAVRLAPDRVVAWVVLGDVARQAELWADARAALEQALRIDPRNAEARDLLRSLPRSSGRETAAH